MKKSTRLSTKKKVSLVKEHHEGKSITKISEENGISRTIFYKWLKLYSSGSKINSPASLIPQNPKGARHWRKIIKPKEHKVITYSLKNPDSSIREIAQHTSLSIGSVWKILRNIRLDNPERRREYARMHGIHIYKPVSVIQKLRMLELYENGGVVAKICREAGVSRTIFYRWLKSYRASSAKDNILQNNRPSGKSHWRFRQEVTDGIVMIALANPTFSLSEITYAAKEKGLSISRSGLYYILKRMELTSYETRLAYASQRPINSRSGNLPMSSSPVYIGYSDFLPRLISLCLVSFIGGVVLFYAMPYMSQVVKYVNPDVAVIQNIKNKISTAITSHNRQNPEPPSKPKASISFGNTLYVPERSGQDLGLGALSINTPKDSYLPEEGISIGFGAIDHLGQTICNADINFEVYRPDGVISNSFSSGRGIRQSGKCSLQSVTNTADYLANITPTYKSGIYRIHARVKTYEGITEYDKNLVISANKQRFEIERNSYPSRIFPTNSYPVEIQIKANIDFKGEISESIPHGIMPQVISGGGIKFRNNDDNSTVIRWKVQMHKGETYRISYNLRFPNVWPAFYEMGPIKIVDKATGKIIYQEARYWDVVSDAAN